MSDCSTFDCSSYHMNLDNLPLSINCFGKECTAEECCTVTPPSCEGFDCSKHPILFAGNVSVCRFASETP